MTLLRPSGAHLNRNGDREAPADETPGELRPEDEQVIAQARAAMREKGYPMALSSVRRLYRQHLRAQARGDFLPYLLTYVDSTGETAAWNISRRCA